MASSPKQTFLVCGRLRVEPAALPQTRSQFPIPGLVSRTSGHGPFLDILVAKPWTEMSFPYPTSYSASTKSAGPNKGLLHLSEATPDTTPWSNAFRPLSIGFLRVSPWPSEDPQHLDLPG